MKRNFEPQNYVNTLEGYGVFLNGYPPKRFNPAVVGQGYILKYVGDSFFDDIFYQYISDEMVALI